jgi:membrane-bound serine protease (ClpP class)
MRALRVLVISVWVLVLTLVSASCLANTDQPPRLIAIDGAIGPPVAHYVERSLTEAASEQAPFVVIRLDTPGGLSVSMRDVIKAILAAPMPVICWVGPKGARAASAGTYILYSCGLAAMAPGTNVGAATPVQLTGLGGSNTPAKPQTAEEKKVLNDAVAYIDSLAQLRGRNADWARKAVKEGDSLTAGDALNRRVIDLIAPDLPALLEKINGLSIPTANGKAVVHSEQAVLEPLQRSWKERFLTVLATPTVAYILLMIGIYGLILEGLHPGALLPGTLGAICLILALFALQVLPVSWAGFGLIILGAALLVAEAFVPSFGTLGLGGLVAFVIGSVMLFDTDAPGYSLPAAYIGSAAFLAALGLGVIVYFLMKMRRRPVVSGREGMIGITVKALQDFDEEGYVLAAGERWLARSSQPVKKGDKLVTVKMDGLTLHVRPAN